MVVLGDIKFISLYESGVCLARVIIKVFRLCTFSAVYCPADHLQSPRNNLQEVAEADSQHSQS